VGSRELVAVRARGGHSQEHEQHGAEVGAAARIRGDWNGSNGSPRVQRVVPTYDSLRTLGTSDKLLAMVRRWEDPSLENGASSSTGYAASNSTIRGEERGHEENQPSTSSASPLNSHKQ
jgi:hypothetical protein